MFYLSGFSLIAKKLAVLAARWNLRQNYRSGRTGESPVRLALTASRGAEESL